MRDVMLASKLRMFVVKTVYFLSPWSYAGLLTMLLAWGDGLALAQQTDSLCPTPALDRVVSHKVGDGESLDSIAQKYNLIPATLMGMNPETRSGRVTVGQTLFVPPYNGIRVEVPAGRLIKDVARQYKVRADVLFELNGCQPSPRVVFIPGVNWSPSQGSAPSNGASTGKPSNIPAFSLSYPLAKPAEVLMGYGWKQRTDAQVALHSGWDLAGEVGTNVLAASAGTVAFVGDQAAYGNLIVINHSQGYQTRYAQLDKIMVKKGQTVKAGDPIGTIGKSGLPSSPDPHLHFELRSNSKLGWVAEDPSNFLR
jgi:murein DD-endopeptidase MepM/ murein hydrolase activator NlpD